MARIPRYLTNVGAAIGYRLFSLHAVKSGEAVLGLLSVLVEFLVELVYLGPPAAGTKARTKPGSQAPPC